MKCTSSEKSSMFWLTSRCSAHKAEWIWISSGYLKDTNKSGTKPNEFGFVERAYLLSGLFFEN